MVPKPAIFKVVVELRPCRRRNSLGSKRMSAIPKVQERRPEPLQQARPRALKEQHLAAAPFGAWQVLPLSKHRGPVDPRLAGLLKAVTHAHAWFGLSTGLVGPPLLWSRSPWSRSRRSLGTLPKLFT